MGSQGDAFKDMLKKLQCGRRTFIPLFIIRQFFLSPSHWAQIFRHRDGLEN